MHRDAQPQTDDDRFRLLVAGHELRGPITVIRGYLSMLDQGSLGDLSAEARRAVGVVLAKAEEANLIVDQLLETARVEEGRLTLRLEPADLRELVAIAVDRKRPLLSERHRLEVDLPDVTSEPGGWTTFRLVLPRPRAV